MITERDRDIINFIYDIGYASINHIADMFFPNQNYNYDLARKRLKKIKENSNYLKCIRNYDTNQLVYLPYESKLKNITKHKTVALNYLCGLKKLGCVMQKIELEKSFNNIIPDIFISFEFNGYRYYQLVEVQLRHDFVDINRFDNVMDNILQETNNIVPNVVIIQNTGKDYSKENKTPMDIIQLNLKLDDIAKVLI